MHELKLSPDGTRVYVTGTSFGTTGDDYATVAYDAVTGAQLWEARYDDPKHGSDYGYDLAVSPDGTRVFVTGASDQPFGERTDYATVAYDAMTGRRVWLARYGGPADENDDALAVAVSPDGARVFVTGDSFGSNGYDYATIAYDAAGGSQLWITTYNGPGNFQDIPQAIAISPDGSRVYVTGKSSADCCGAYDVATIAYDAASGQQVWLMRYDDGANGDDEGGSLSLSPDGARLYVVGHTGPYSQPDYVVLAYDTGGGTQLWAATYDGPVHGPDSACCIGVSPDGSGVYITGYSAGPQDPWDVATLAYDAVSGSQLWVTRYDGPGDGVDAAHSLAVGPGGRVYVTGTASTSMDGSDYATFVYNASSGRQVWSARYDGTGNDTDQAASIAVSSDGQRWYVSGDSDPPNGLPDYVTIGYSR